MANTPAIKTNGLKKHFGDVKAVDGISIEVAKGSVVALLGPNGAGKTTTINLLTTQLLPDGGSATIMGNDVAKKPKKVRNLVGMTFQETSVDPALTGMQVLSFSGELYGMKKKSIRVKMKELLEMVGLTDAAKRKTKTYSGGMKRRLEIARALINSPAVLVLDEPTLGLDPQTRAKVWEFIRHLKDESGMTLLMTTHYMEEAEKLSDYVYIIDNGKIVREGKPEDLIRELGDDTVRLSGEGDADVFSAKLGEQDYVQALNSSGSELIHIGVDSGQKRVPQILGLAAETGFVVREVGIDRPTLGDVFFSATGREIRE
jgi:ABC-2 type transport system ATP-binding protein